MSLGGGRERGEGTLQQMPLLALGKNCFSHYHSLSQSLEDSEVGLEKKNETTTQWCNSNFRKDAFQLMCMFCFGDKLPEMLLVVLNAKENCIFSVRLLKCLSFH